MWLDYLLAAFVLIPAGVILYRIIRRKPGASGCSSCSGCPHQGHCGEAGKK